MFIRGKVINVSGLVLVSLIAHGIFAFAGEDAYTQEETIDLQAIRQKEDRQKEERGLRLAKKAVELADPYPGMKTEVSRKSDELESLTERKRHLTTTIQRLRTGLMKKKAEYARSPELLRVSVRQYTRKIAEMEDELVEVERQIPALESKLATVNLELQVEEIERGIPDDEEKDADEYEEEFEEAILGRWDILKQVLPQKD